MIAAQMIICANGAERRSPPTSDMMYDMIIYVGAKFFFFGTIVGQACLKD